MNRATCSRLPPWGHSAPPTPSPSPAAAGDGGAGWPHGVSHSRPDAAASAATAADADAPSPAPALSQLPPAAASGDGAAYGAGEAACMPPRPVLETVLPEGKEGGRGECSTWLTTLGLAGSQWAEGSSSGVWRSPEPSTLREAKGGELRR